MKNRRKIKVEQTLQYNLTIWKKNNYFYILNNISKYLTLVHLIDSLGNFNCAISVVRYSIFYSNYETALFLTQESLDIIFSTSIDKELVATFRSAFYAVRYRGSIPRIRIISFFNVMKIHGKKPTHARRYLVCSAVLAVLTSKEIPLPFKLIKPGARMQLFGDEFSLQGSFHCKSAFSVEPNRKFG